MDHKREHRTPPTSKGHGSGLTTTFTKLLCGGVSNGSEHKWLRDQDCEERPPYDYLPYSPD